MRHSRRDARAAVLTQRLFPNFSELQVASTASSRPAVAVRESTRLVRVRSSSAIAVPHRRLAELKQKLTALRSIC